MFGPIGRVFNQALGRTPKTADQTADAPTCPSNCADTRAVEEERGPSFLYLAAGHFALTVATPILSLLTLGSYTNNLAQSDTLSLGAGAVIALGGGLLSVCHFLQVLPRPQVAAPTESTPDPAPASATPVPTGAAAPASPTWLRSDDSFLANSTANDTSATTIATSMMMGTM